ncbi:hypothetical protein N7540_002476 [Penicillium herquei]|nr:hypothetical protein N7540_002476 [Penicillium herquei]
MDTSLDNVELSEICFLEDSELASTTFADIFLVSVRNHRCVMKVHHGTGPRQYYDSKDRELDIHVLESTAYRRLK